MGGATIVGGEGGEAEVEAEGICVGIVAALIGLAPASTAGGTALGSIGVGTDGATSGVGG